MNGWHGRRLCALSLVACGLLLGGCQAGPVARPGSANDLPGLIAHADSPAVSRGQKPDPAVNPLNFKPEDPGSGETRAVRVRAMVNDATITDEEVLAAAYQGLIGAKTEAEKAEILNAKLNEIIDREVVLQNAEALLANKQGGKFIKELKKAASDEFEKQWLYKLMNANKMTDVKAFKEYCAGMGMSVDLIRRQWERSFIAMEYLRGRIEPTINKISNRDVSEYYDRHPDEFKVEEHVEWQDLFVAAARHPSKEAARQFAESLAGRIMAGQDFATLSKQHDQGDASLRENSLGIGNKRGEVKPAEAEAVVFQLKPGEVGPLVEMEGGYHIIKVLKRTEAGQRPFDDKVQKQIKDKLRGQVFQREMKDFVRKLRQNAVIQVADTIK